MRDTTLERFHKHVIMPDNPSECWAWSSARATNGYPVFSVNGKRGVLVHRYSFELYIGPIPPGMFVARACKNRSCVNPAHLYLADRPNVKRKLEGNQKEDASGTRHPEIEASEG